MELLKKTIVLVFAAFTLQTYAQEPMVINAFSASYDFESSYKYSDAIVALQKVYDTQSYEMNIRIAWLCCQSGQYAESVSYYQKAIALMPAATEPLWGIINPLFKLEKWSELEKTYRAILKIDSKNALAHYRMGQVYYYRKDYLTAKKYFDVALNQYPFNYDYMLLSAWTNYYLNNKKEAHILFSKMLLYKPNDSAALEGLSLIK
jgi:tetratricopeptide (TPR) repeat protein